MANPAFDRGRGDLCHDADDETAQRASRGPAPCLAKREAQRHGSELDGEPPCRIEQLSCAGRRCRAPATWPAGRARPTAHSGKRSDARLIGSAISPPSVGPALACTLPSRCSCADVPRHRPSHIAEPDASNVHSASFPRGHGPPVGAGFALPKKGVANSASTTECAWHIVN
jgi:hypothetical protein